MQALSLSLVSKHTSLSCISMPVALWSANEIYGTNDRPQGFTKVQGDERDV
jgi:hypothetical protein